LQSAGALLLVATVNGRIVGSVIDGWDGWRGHIYRLAGAPEHWRKGVARRLIVEISAEFPYQKLYGKLASRSILECFGDAVGVHLTLELRYLVGEYQQIVFAALAIFNVVAQ